GERYFIERYNRVCEAYEILRDPAKKAAYDQQLDESRCEKSVVAQSKVYQRKHIHQFQEEKFVAEVILRNDARKSNSQIPLTSLRSVEIKKNAELTFDDKSWILLASAMSVGSIGILMSRRFRAEGYVRKSKQAGLMAALGVAGMILFIILVRYLRSIYVY